MSGQQYDNTNRGAIFKNKRKETDNHPNMTGTLNVEGREYWVSAWTKTKQDGEKFQSLSIKAKEVKAGVQRESENPAPQGHRAPVSDDLDDTIPFEMEWR